MKVIVTKDYEEMSREAGKIFIERIREKPEIVLGLATGSTPIGLYNELIRAHREEGLDFSRVRTFNLDEYVGLSSEDETSYRYFMNDNLFNHINIRPENISIPDGRARDLDKFCRDYDQKIEDIGGIDLQLLGIGEDGHIAFNEPGTYLNVGTNITSLAESTIEVNSRFFDSIDDVPKTAITLGMGGIMKAKEIVLLANGEKKSQVIKKLLTEGRVSTELPVSFLLVHPNVTIILDEAAYGGLK